jgi:hypothetical protein
VRKGFSPRRTPPESGAQQRITTDSFDSRFHPRRRCLRSSEMWVIENRRAPPCLMRHVSAPAQGGASMIINGTARGRSRRLPALFRRSVGPSSGGGLYQSSTGSMVVGLKARCLRP